MTSLITRFSEKNPSIIVCLLNVFKKEFPEQSNAYNNYKFICKIWDSFPKITVRLFPINYLSGNNLFAGFKKMYVLIFP